MIDISQFIIPAADLKRFAAEEAAVYNALETARSRLYTPARAQFERALVRASEVPEEVIDQMYADREGVRMFRFQLHTLRN